MQFTETFSLPCPDDTDYGAIALVMQKMAFSVEDLLVVQRERYAQFNEQPTAIWTRLTSIGPVSSSGSTEITWSSTTGTASVFRNYTSPNTSFGAGVPSAGIYHVGYYANTTCVGAVSNDTFRLIRFDVERQVPSGTDVVSTLYRTVQEENVAGGNFFGADGVILIESDFFNYRFRVTFTHGNAASDMTIQPGAIGWFTRIGLSEVIEVS